MVTSLRPKPGPTRSYHFPDFHDEMLQSGIRLVTAPVAKLPVVTVMVVVDAGSTNDPTGKEGVAALTAGTLLEGTQQFDGAELAEKFEQLGTSVESGADWDSAFMKITVLSGQLEEATKLLGEVISSPIFPEREVERAKAERLAEILQLEMEPRGLADEKFSEFLYTDESRYSKPDEGSTASVSALSRKDVEEFYKSRYRAGATTVIITGDISTDDARALITRSFQRWPSGVTPNRPLIVAARTTRKSVHIVDKPEAPQSELRAGHVGLPRKHPDFFPTLVMNAVLGGLFGSRINLNLREAHGYTYGASSFYDWRRGPGPFVISTAVQSEVTAPALREILLELNRIRGERISEEELLLARDYLEGVFPIRYETTAAIASALATLVIYDLPEDYFESYRKNIRGVSADSVLKAAKTHLHPDQLQTIVVGDARTIRASISELSIGDLHVHSS
ncbi:MAG TPA: pitrilysin family protein [Gemmatimonadaceae bacterium]|nr:pitrilysin family protein [Gemmatimonadaceae bacterium]